MNLFNVDIRGTNNYKGIVTLGTDVTEGLTTTLKALGDGVGGYSPLQLSTTEVKVNSKLTINNTLEGSTSGRMNITAQYDLAIITGNSAAGVGGLFVGGAGQAASARLHVKGDGVNPTARLEAAGSADIQRWYWNDNTTLGLSVNSLGNIVLGQGAGSGYFYGGANSTNYITIARGGYHIEHMITQPFLDFNGQNGFHQFKTNNNKSTSGTGAIIYAQSSFVPSGNSTANPRGIWIDYTLNRNGFTTSGTATGIFVNATETDITGMTHNLMDLQVGGATKFSVDRTGVTYINDEANVSWLRIRNTANGVYLQGVGFIRSGGSSGKICLTDSTDTSFNMLQFGGTTNAFPALKRSSAELQVRLADDSGYANLRVNAIYTEGGAYLKDNNAISGAGDGRISFKTWSNMVLNVSDNGTHIVQGSYTANNASSILELTSTTKGFLPPRMTTTQKNAIATPATGLVVFDTTLAKLAVYTGAAWETVTSV